ncbi:YfiR family protein [Planctomycetales bacterium ZRK34]|nr:YfiR family protein [Planctomycetales bacterium ZRK34]
MATMTLLATFSMSAGDSVDQEKLLQVKAAYLINFARFTTWPDVKFESDHAPLIIGLFESDPIKPIIARMIKGREVAGHPLKIMRLKLPPSASGTSHQKEFEKQLKSCHLIYVSNMHNHAARQLIKSVKHAAVLTIGEGESFVRQGGMLSFLVEAGRVLFYANPDAIESSDLRVSSKVLKLARIAGSNTGE